MVIVIVNKEFNYETGKYENIISHGIDTENDAIITLPCVDVALCDWVGFDSVTGEYYIKEE